MKHLTLKSFAEAADKALAEQKLAIQNEDGLIEYLTVDDGPACLNTYPPRFFGDKSCHCIIGTALDMPPGHRYIDIGVHDLVALNLATMDSGVGVQLGAMQGQHDGIVSDLKTRLRETHPLSDDRKAALESWRDQRDRFLEHVKEFIAKHKEAA